MRSAQNCPHRASCFCVEECRKKRHDDDRAPRWFAPIVTLVIGAAAVYMLVILLTLQEASK